MATLDTCAFKYKKAIDIKKSESILCDKMKNNDNSIVGKER